eukprot:3078115-Rhodomonas_salina.1
MDGKVEEVPFASACVQLWEGPDSKVLAPVAKSIRWTHQEEKAEAEAVFALAGYTPAFSSAMSGPHVASPLNLLCDIPG